MWLISLPAATEWETSLSKVVDIIHLNIVDVLKHFKVLIIVENFQLNL